MADEVGGGLIDETIAYVTADELRPSPYATAYEITDRLPFNVKKLKALLRERGVGVLTVKKRGLRGGAGGAAPQGDAEAVREGVGDGVPDPGRGGAHDAGGRPRGSIAEAPPRAPLLNRRRGLRAGGPGGARSQSPEGLDLPSRNSRSRSLRVSAAARSNSARASSVRPSRSSRSPRTLDSKW